MNRTNKKAQKYQNNKVKFSERPKPVPSKRKTTNNQVRSLTQRLTHVRSKLRNCRKSLQSWWRDMMIEDYELAEKKLLEQLSKLEVHDALSRNYVRDTV